MQLNLIKNLKKKCPETIENTKTVLYYYIKQNYP